jgi:hypothetical protein
MRYRATAIVVFWLFACTGRLAADARLPLLAIRPAVAAPEIDGKLDDPCWKDAACAAPFVEVGGQKIAAEQTSVFITYTDRALCLAFVCRESKMERAIARRTERDSQVWTDESVEVFLQPKGARNYHHLIVNTIGTQYDEIGKDPKSWNGKWQAAAAREQDEWVVEISLPFRELGAPKAPVGQAWRFNVCREEKPSGENSAWSPTGLGFHAPSRFGTLYFGDAATPTVRLRDTGDPFLGAHDASISIAAGQAPASLKCFAEVDGARQPIAEVSLQQRETRLVALQYQVRKEGDHALRLCSYLKPSGAPLFISAPLPFSIEPLISRLESLSREADAILQAAQRKRRRGEANELRELRLTIRRLLAVARHREQWAPRKDLSLDWERLQRQVADADQRLVRLRYRIYTAHPETGYAVGVESPLRKVMRDLPFTGRLGQPAVVCAARGEYEPVQVVVIALDKPLEGVRVEATDLIGPGASVILGNRISLNLVGWVKTRRPAYDADYVGWYPDPLMDFQPFDLSAGALQPVWVTVRVPPAAEPGEYRGNIIIAPGNAPGTTVPLIVQVWDFPLPRTTHLKTAFALFETEIAAWNGWKELPQETRRQWYEFLLERRINPTNIYSMDPVPPENLMPLCAKRGLNAYNLGVFDSGDFDDRHRLNRRIEFLRGYTARLKQASLLSGAYIYGFDEVQPDRYHQLKAVYGAIRAALPDLPRACTVRPNKDLAGFVDIWVPLTAHYDRAAADARRARGEEVWWYICCGPSHPYANWFIDYPAIEPRLLFWMTWKYGVTGFLYYSLNMWHTNRAAEGLPDYLQAHDDEDALKAIQAGLRWPQVPWNTFTFDRFNGDGHLVYPGAGGKPLSSIRLECIRDGIEDYEYLWLLADLTQRLEEQNPPGPHRALVEQSRALLGVNSKVVRDLTHYTHDAEALSAERERIARQIIACRKALGLSAP